MIFDMYCCFLQKLRFFYYYEFKYYNKNSTNYNELKQRKTNERTYNTSLSFTKGCVLNVGMEHRPRTPLTI